MPENTDESLADAVIDTTPDLDAETFDFAGFLAGVRPTRRSVKIYPRADLIGVMEGLVEAYAEEKDRAKAAAILKDYEAARDEFDTSARMFTVEGRSAEWVEDFRANAASRLGVDPGWDAQEPTPEMVKARETILLHQLAEQLVNPVGATAQGLRTLGERNEGELKKLVVAMSFANDALAQSAKVVSPDFSPASSTKSRTGASSKR